VGCIPKSFTICNPHKILLGHLKKDSVVRSQDIERVIAGQIPILDIIVGTTRSKVTISLRFTALYFVFCS
jgi:hypothetical protein